MEFYNTPHGHPTTDLHSLVTHARNRRESIVFLCGDKSVDCKTPKTSPGRPADIISNADKWADTPIQHKGAMWPARSAKDVAYFVNMLLPCNMVAINCGVAGRTSERRIIQGLLPQEKLVRDNMGESDILFISLGSEELTKKIRSSAWMLNLCPTTMVQKCFGRKIRRLAKRHARDVEIYVRMLTSFTRPRLLMLSDPVYIRHDGVRHDGIRHDGIRHDGAAETNQLSKIQILVKLFKREVSNRLYISCLCDTAQTVRPTDVLLSSDNGETMALALLEQLTHFHRGRESFA